MPYGWTGRILRVDLSRRKFTVWNYDGGLARAFIGGRGFAVKILWDLVPPGADPLGPENRVVLAAGPLTGLPVPSSGKLVLAAKSPLTGGYGDGNMGTLAAVHLRRAGFDAVIIEGSLAKPGYLVIEDGTASIEDAEDLWGLNTFEAERRLRRRHGGDAGYLVIGPAGEHMVRYATVISQEGRSGGRPGIGAVMGSKKLKAIVVRGSNEVSTANSEELRRLGAEAYREIAESPSYHLWRRQGTMMAVRWSQENSVLPTFNFSEGVFDEVDGINAHAMERIKVEQRTCPMCNASCGNVVFDAEGRKAELDYENVAMLGSNLGIGDLGKVATLNRMADELGVDTISIGSCIAFAMEAREKGLVDEAVEWGDYEAARTLMREIVYGESELGRMLSRGVRDAAMRIGRGAEEFAMHVKGLEVSAYDCHAAPGMALAYGTSPIGAHHKDAWVISWEVKTNRLAYSRDKVAKVVEFQRIRGGMFESLVTCRLPWIELGFSLDWYPRFLKAATGIAFTLEDIFAIADRVYDLIRAFWVREYAADGVEWTRRMDYPPAKWFKRPLSKGPYAGAKLNVDGYDSMLSAYYAMRGWDERGIPRKSVLESRGLGFAASQLEAMGVRLSP